MSLTQQQGNAINSAVWLVGIGALIATRWWWPGIMFVIGVSGVVQGLVEGRGWLAFQGSLWSFGIGVWVLCRYNMFVFFCLIALSGLVAAFLPAERGEKPAVDNSLE